MASDGVWRLLPDSATVLRGQLFLAGCCVADLAAEYGTPLYLYDEQTLRLGTRRVLAALGPSTRVSFAVKACSIPGVLRVFEEEGLSFDVVSEGEIEAAIRAGVSADRMHLHGNLKSDCDLRRAVDLGVRAIVLDNLEEIERLEEICRERETEAAVMIRLGLPVDVRTHPAIDTSGPASKFGFERGSAELSGALQRLRESPRLQLIGGHVHLGSQVTEPELYRDAATELLAFASDLRAIGFSVEELSLGGGWAVPYRREDPELEADQIAKIVPDAEDARWAVEPGRALVARAGIAMYEVGAVKHRAGRRLVVVNGGMGDNPRPALYGAQYEVLTPERMDDPPSGTADVVGRYCESGDTLARGVELADVAAGDLLAIPVSGAYHLSMAGTYNLIPQPAAVLVGEAGHRLLTRRATPDDMLARELPLNRD